MTYAKFKENVIGKGYTDKAGLRKFTIRVGLFTIIMTFVLSLFVASIVNTILGVCAIVLSFAIFFMLLDYAQQDVETFNIINNYAKYWWSCIPVSFVLFGILYVFNFI